MTGRPAEQDAAAGTTGAQTCMNPQLHCQNPLHRRLWIDDVLKACHPKRKIRHFCLSGSGALLAIWRRSSCSLRSPLETGPQEHLYAPRLLASLLIQSIPVAITPPLPQVRPLPKITDTLSYVRRPGQRLPWPLTTTFCGRHRCLFCQERSWVLQASGITSSDLETLAKDGLDGDVGLAVLLLGPT